MPGELFSKVSCEIVQSGTRGVHGPLVVGRVELLDGEVLDCHIRGVALKGAVVLPLAGQDGPRRADVGVA